MMLRIQRERIAASLLPALADYTIGYQLGTQRLRLLPKHAVVLHPGPYNRGVELTDEALADPRSRYETQVTNGVFVRMAALDLLVNGTAVRA
jgi:aspartate carbamoyltransferase catalytic subunit